MLELSHERIGCILEEETPKTEEMTTILRAIYTRYMVLYEKYFADIDALDSDRIAELKKYHEETQSLIKYYYMDIPQDICRGLNEFEEKSSSLLLGPNWHQYLFKSYDDFKEENGIYGIKDKEFKTEYAKSVLKAFYETMNHIFRDGFGTGTKTVEKMVSGISSLLFGKREEEED